MSLQDTRAEDAFTDDWIRSTRGPFGRTREEVEEAAMAAGLWPITDDQWRVIQFVRAYTLENARFPALVRVARATGYRLQHLEEMFPGGAIRTTLRLLGLDLPFDLQPGCPFAVGESN